ncbi:hypothetical protein JGB26_02595 [Streptomyces flavofungini]|uniref:Serine/threonine protein kinase n=1 Tax=Streptomyces flavofungini TaxID=68200 RepID=A0ABS0WYL4_9ACTN|nr:hypothetical protein [Streptomyces flavofungini]
MNPRLLALLGVVALAVLVPLAGASAGPVLHEDAKRPAEGLLSERSGPSESGRSESGPSGRAPAGSSPRSSSPPSSPPQSPPPSRPQDKPADPAAPAYDSAPPAETTARCGPELSSPHGVEAQTCVLSQADDTWARTYYRNATGEALTAVLSVMGPKGRTVEMHCAVGADDEPAACETPRERTAGGAARYTAVAEFARAGGAALLLRSGSN